MIVDDFAINSIRTIIMEANTHLGKSSKNGPIHRSMTSSNKQDTTLAICVRPPTVCWMRDLLREAEIGMQEKKDPTTLLKP